MKLVCTVSIGFRQNATAPSTIKKKQISSTLALCQHPKSCEYCVILFTSQNRAGTKYALKGNIMKILTRFVDEGKVTIQFQNPCHDLYVQADVLPLKSFLHLFRRILENKVNEKELSLSSLGVTGIAKKDMAVKKLVIQTRSDYPLKGLPRTLEKLYINGIKRCSLDVGVLRLHKLKILDVGDNLIETIPSELNKLPNLSELILRDNLLGKSAPNRWDWLGGNLLKSLKLLNLRGNELKFLPDQICRLTSIVTLHIDSNSLKKLPSGFGNLHTLQTLTMSNNEFCSFPGSIVQLSLHTIDVSQNTFHNNPNCCLPGEIPKRNQIASLLEKAACTVTKFKLSFSKETLPIALIQYLDSARYCICGRPCFETFISCQQVISLGKIAKNIIKDGEMRQYNIDFSLCSLRCFQRIVATKQRPSIVR